jgi:hypothetical protein
MSSEGQLKSSNGSEPVTSNYSKPPPTLSGAASAQSGDLLTEPCGLYIVLWSRGEAHTFHWGLYLALTESEGMLYHQINGDTASGDWELEILDQQPIPQADILLAALKVGIYGLGIESDGVEYLTDILKSVERGPAGTCRTWLMDALFEVADSGLIDMQPKKKTMEDVEREATVLATRAASRGVKLAARSRYSRS